MAKMCLWINCNRGLRQFYQEYYHCKRISKPDVIDQIMTVGCEVVEMESTRERHGLSASLILSHLFLRSRYEYVFILVGKKLNIQSGDRWGN